ncbi:SCO2584 family spore wall biosynthesis protein [Streptomyces gelaticus]
MPDDVGGRPFPDGWEPDDDRGGADEDFASVVFDEEFVRAAEIHEPTAVERLLAAAQARAEAEASRARAGGGPLDEDLYEEGYGPGAYGRESAYDDPLDLDDDGYGSGPYGRHGGALRPYRGAARWHRPVAWLLAVLMGIGMVALAFSAVYRNSSGSRQDPAPPPATTGVDRAPGAVPDATPSAATGYPRPTVSAIPRTD